MDEKEIIEWCEKRLSEGASRKEIIESLFQEGYTGSEVERILKSSLGQHQDSESFEEDINLKIKELTVEESAPKKHEGPKYAEVSREPKREDLSELVKKESPTLWSSIILFFVFIAVLISLLLFLFLSPQGREIWDINPKVDVDELPPVVSVKYDSEWFDFASIDPECSDDGKDFVSGCNAESFRFFISESDSCPQDYSLYSEEILDGGEGFLCVSAKDNDGNTGFSSPIEVKFDRSDPSSVILENDSWFESSFYSEIMDFDEDSGVSLCEYSILAGEVTVRDWTKRQCNSSVVVPVGSGGCKDGAPCVIKTRVFDRAGNTGTSEAEFKIDLNAPSAELSGINPSSIENGRLAVGKGQLSVSGSVSDSNLDFWVLTIFGTAGSFELDGGNSEVDGQIASFDSENFSDGFFSLNLTAVDLSGKASSSKLEFYVSPVEIPDTNESNDTDPENFSCESGVSEDCGWLQGVCSFSQRICVDGEWGDCLIESAPGFESVEQSCNDSSDNDCDGLSDCNDPDCSAYAGCEDCSPDGSLCSENTECCSGKCDPDEGHCFSCQSNIDSESGTCESDLCGASPQCDELLPGSLSNNTNYCCDSACLVDSTVGSCFCSGGDCSGGSCSTGNTCYHGVSCGSNGWEGESCSLSDSCSVSSLQTGKSCTPSGCDGLEYQCNSSNECSLGASDVLCGSDVFNCHFDDFAGYRWISSPFGLESDCDDGHDNDCDGFMDSQDENCDLCGNDVLDLGEECDGDEDDACPGKCMDSDCTCGTVVSTVSDSCGDNATGWSLPEVNASQCGWPAGSDGNVIDCCCCYLHTHVLDLGEVFEGGRVNITFMAGNYPGCLDTMELFRSTDGNSWSKIGENVVYGKATTRIVLKTLSEFRYFKIHIPNCFVDDSEAKLLCFSEEDCGNGIDDDCDGLSDGNDPDCS